MCVTQSIFKVSLTFSLTFFKINMNFVSTVSSTIPLAPLQVSSAEMRLRALTTSWRVFQATGLLVEPSTYYGLVSSAAPAAKFVLILSLDESGAAATTATTFCSSFCSTCVTCPICIGCLQLPVKLSCGHTFCAECFAEQVVNCVNAVNCAMCRQIPSRVYCMSIDAYTFLKNKEISRMENS